MNLLEEEFVLAATVSAIPWPKGRTLYFQCWTEGNTIFVSDNPLDAEVTRNIEHIKSLLSRIKSHYSELRFLSEQTQKEIDAPTLKVAKLIISHEFVE